MTCSTGPGKFEGEGPETFLLYSLALDGGMAEEVNNPEWGDGAAIIRGPWVPDTERMLATVAEGYASPCVADAVVRLGRMSGAILTWGSTGFVTATVYPGNDPMALAEHWAEVTEEYEGGPE